VRSGQIRNLESARVSMAGQLKLVNVKECEVDKGSKEASSISHSVMRTEITEEEENESDTPPKIQQKQTDQNASEFKMPQVNIFRIFFLMKFMNSLRIRKKIEESNRTL
jgi:hypothetical protein